MKKIYRVLVLTAILCVGFVTGVAASGNETISAIINRSITIVYNGEKQDFVDVNGNAVYPISYNGTTYLPLRAVAELLDLDVDYDATTETAYLGGMEKQPVNLVNQKNSGGTEWSTIIRDAEELKVVGDSATMTYSTGIKWHQWNSKASSGKNFDIDFNVDGYSSITFTAWAEVDSKVGIYDEDGKVIASFDLKAGTMATKTMDISGNDYIAFASNALEYGAESGYIKILDPVIS